MTEPFPAEGLSLHQARERVLHACRPLTRPPDQVPLSLAAGRVSAEHLLAKDAVPGFRASIMDGYALGQADVPQVGQVWTLVGRSAPGAPFLGTLRAGTAVRILTGAPVPDGGDWVVPQELVAILPGAIRLERAASANPWIRAADEETAQGAVLLEPGVRLGVAELARLASCGVAELAVRPRPRLSLLITGDELRPPGTERGPGQIWESNGTLLKALLERLGMPVQRCRVMPDEPDALQQALLELAAESDLVVTTGGVSAGDADWVRPLLAQLGQVNFWKLFLKPGRPLAFGSLKAGRDWVPFFGLPGNPVAAAVTALQLVWPALQQLEGGTLTLLPRVRVRLASPLQRSAGRPELARACLQVSADGRLEARVEGSQASSRLGSLAGADLLLEIPPNCTNLQVGEELWAQVLRLPIL